MSGVPRLLLAIGDPNGIGPEIAVKAVAELGTAAPVVVGDRHVVEPYAARAGLTLREAAPGATAAPGVCDLVDVGALAPSELAVGEVSAAAGAATIAYASAAIRLAVGGGYTGVVACPHSETAVHRAGIYFAGYPPLIAELTGTRADQVFLMLVGGGMRIAHVTLHERLAGSLARLTPELVIEAGLALHRTLLAMGVTHPRIGVFGINPHAGEGGLFGEDDSRVTEPAVAALRDRGVRVDGPTGADILLGGDRDADAYLAMYHDQGHIPIKTLAGRTAAAVTIGAGAPFASVGHGPAFNIAGQGIADPSAVLAALRLLAPTPQEALR
ncbi:PdxA family dehydrogenase [Pseudarthrobacter enclensis]|uniref:4-hydroxythreonine-4-phosphate dehydrogenase n=1 Tax=Pseudarthrobacter enclensis TaxID=993070 RepID=A0ABT9RTP1_9MICC|nr:4-hydroxythreonine-4-phosphate dehydrogenase PdxA [Pseudarthrobacter enclensis]MDP9888618.1 4-hydroxythreonine-4-phosphate dehydrogenase [Pseudarthrobacter enclensis]